MVIAGMSINKISPKERVQSGKRGGLDRILESGTSTVSNLFLYYVNSAFKWNTPGSQCCVFPGILFIAQAN